MRSFNTGDIYIYVNGIVKVVVRKKDLYLRIFLVGR